MKPQNTKIWSEMMSGNPYNALDPILISELNRVKTLIREFNTIAPTDTAALTVKIREILGSSTERIRVIQPFLCDYGSNIHVGDNFFANFNFTVLDEGRVTIGRNCWIGPNVGIYTACHPTDPAERAKGIEWSEPVTIGDDCWIGGGVTILPGVTIGNNVTIGAGSVVTRSIPDSVIAVGNPCRVIRHV